MTKELVKKFIHELKNEVTNNSTLSEKERDEMCRYLGRALSPRHSVEECQKFLNDTQWPGGDDAESLKAWYAVRRVKKNNGHPSQVKGSGKSKKATDEDMATVLRELANVRGISTTKLLKELSNVIHDSAKRKHETLLYDAREALNAVNEFRAANADIINEYERLNDVYLQAKNKADSWAHEHNIK